MTEGHGDKETKTELEERAEREKGGGEKGRTKCHGE